MSFLLSIAAAFLIAQVAWPLFRQSMVLLSQQTPDSPAMRDGFARAVRELSTFPGVLEVRNVHSWALHLGHSVGSLHIRARADADERAILDHATQLLGKWLCDVTVQTEKDVDLNLWGTTPA
eukprot:GABV01002121.1.p1 GENE.GABV01002121.1~~GABV01002121.1.p1  ORF type:complete len:122 (+),score=21.02 GABV01002121.1:375-740(+)